MLKTITVAVVLLTAVLPLWASSYYSSRPDDGKAVYLTREQFSFRGDGVDDAANSVQQAIDRVQETQGQGSVLVPSGRYRLTETIYIWPGIRVIGYGSTRPTFVLGPSTVGFQKGPAYMVFFAGGRPGYTRKFHQRPTTPDDNVPEDASPGSFYSALTNVDFEIEEGNPGAVGVRAHYAQHCFLAHMDFHIGSGLAGIHDGGNVAEDVHFYGGQYGIWTRKPSPGWQFTVIDATFEGQREAAIREHEAGLTLIRPQFKDVPTAISIDPKYSDELWVKDARMENISGPAVVISNEKNARTEVNMENVACSKVPVFVSYRESGKQVAGPGISYAVFCLKKKNNFDDIGSIPAIRDGYETTAIAALPGTTESTMPALPPMATWGN